MTRSGWLLGINRSRRGGRQEKQGRGGAQSNSGPIWRSPLVTNHDCTHAFSLSWVKPLLAERDSPYAVAAGALLPHLYNIGGVGPAPHSSATASRSTLSPPVPGAGMIDGDGKKRITMIT